MEKDCIRKIMKASGVTAGEKVLIHFWGEDEQKTVANEFMAAVASLGATPVLLQQARSVNYAVFSEAEDTCFDESYFDSLSRFDAVLDVFAYQPILLGGQLGAEQMERYRRYISSLFYALMKAKRFAQIRIPTVENAQESLLEPEEYIRRMNAAYDVDYDALLDACGSAKKKMEHSSRYVLRTGEKCELCFDFSDREWFVDAGDGDWPCGEIYIAPNEGKTRGTIFFEKLFVEEIGTFNCITLSVKEGRLVDADQERAANWIRSLTPENAVVCEFGLGMNPGVTQLCGETVLDEKMAGSFHIAIGANHMFGGQNRAQTHMDLVNDGRFELLPLD